MAACSVSSCSAVSTACGSQVGPGEFVHGPFHNLPLSPCDTDTRRVAARPVAAARGSRFSPSIEVRGPTAAAARIREAASPGESCSTRIRNWLRVEEQYSSGQVGGLQRRRSTGDRLAGCCVADGFEALPHRDLLVS